ncbi:hypothetical protein WA158_001407 [Blastocystis sp. Blastoise]
MKAFVFVFVALFAICLARPNSDERKFVSPVVDKFIEEFKNKLSNKRLAEIFENCYPNTLDTTIFSYTTGESTSDEDTFLVTGDITAMWLRDSTNQISPYIRFANEDPKLASMIRGVINRQVKSILLDPYANAFNYDKFGNVESHHDDSSSRTGIMGVRINALTPEIFERKYEIDSLAAVLLLSYNYYNATLDKTPFDERWEKAVKLIIHTAKENQWHTRPGYGAEYRFSRKTTTPTECLKDEQGWPAAHTNMVRTAFRPSDDAAFLPFNIPGNLMLVVNLRRAAAMLRSIRGNDNLADEASQLANDIEEGVKKYGIIEKEGETSYTFECDGYGNNYFMDDANIPSLLSLPYLGVCSNTDPLYLQTRKFILSERNPYYWKGSAGEGTGGPHQGIGWIWPMSIIMRAYTSEDRDEVKQCLEWLQNSATTGYMHETFWLDNVNSYTRPWFAWANSLFGDLLIHISEKFPELLF